MSHQSQRVSYRKLLDLVGSAPNFPQKLRYLLRSVGILGLVFAGLLLGEIVDRKQSSDIYAENLPTDESITNQEASSPSSQLSGDFYYRHLQSPPRAIGIRLNSPDGGLIALSPQ